MSTGREVDLLDIVSIRLSKHVPNMFQLENWLIDPSHQWERVGSFPKGDLDDLCDYPAQLWDNRYSARHRLNDRAPDVLCRSYRDSLYFVNASNLIIKVDQSYDRKRVSAEFTYNGVRYGMIITDFAMAHKYLSKEPGSYLIASEAYLCISLGLPWEGFAYKLIAGISI